jgi:hypothetical protein
MTTPHAFTALTARVNSAVLQHLSNTSATYQGGAPFDVLFDCEADDAFERAVDATARTVQFEIASTPDLAKGSELVIDGITYVVSSGVQPDASGWVSLTVYPKGA